MGSNCKTIINGSSMPNSPQGRAHTRPSLRGQIRSEQKELQRDALAAERREKCELAPGGMGFLVTHLN